MIKQLALAGLFTVLLTGTALAQATPAETPAAPAQAAIPAPADSTSKAVETADDCLKAATDLAVSIDDKRIAEDKLEQIDDLLTKMETHCDAKQFPEAMAVAKDIKLMIETQ